MKRAIFLGHMGVGDHILLNGLIRHVALSWDSLIVLAKHHNVATCRFMWSDLSNVQVLGIQNDTEAKEICAAFSSYKILRNGLFKGASFDIERWDRSFYEQVGVPFEQSWDGWKVPECQAGFTLPDVPYAFVHEDPARGYYAQMNRLPDNLVHVHSQEKGSKNIFQWVNVLRNSEEIHCMESCFAILVDRLDGIKARRLCVHAYMRNSRPPVYRKKWEILK